jgi:hypothetical protein
LSSSPHPPAVSAAALPGVLPFAAALASAALLPSADPLASAGTLTASPVDIFATAPAAFALHAFSPDVTAAAKDIFSLLSYCPLSAVIPLSHPVPPSAVHLAACGLVSVNVPLLQFPGLPVHCAALRETAQITPGLPGPFRRLAEFSGSIPVSVCNTSSVYCIVTPPVLAIAVASMTMKSVNPVPIYIDNVIVPIKITP